MNENVKYEIVTRNCPFYVPETHIMYFSNLSAVFETWRPIKTQEVY
jgi:hypothetical protein